MSDYSVEPVDTVIKRITTYCPPNLYASFGESDLDITFEEHEKNHYKLLAEYEKFVLPYKKAATQEVKIQTKKDENHFYNRVRLIEDSFDIVEELMIVKGKDGKTEVFIVDKYILVNASYLGSNNGYVSGKPIKVKFENVKFTEKYLKHFKKS